MSKNNRKERKVNTLSDLSTVVDRETLPVAGLRPVFDDQLPEETGAPQSADAIPLPETEETEIHPVEEVIPDEPVTAAVAEQIAESNTVEEATAAHRRIDEAQRADADLATVALLGEHLLQLELDLAAVEHVELAHAGAQRVPQREAPRLVALLGHR